MSDGPRHRSRRRARGGRAAWPSAPSTACTPVTSSSSAWPSKRPASGASRATVVTFDHHPLAIVDPAHQPRLLTPPAVKQELDRGARRRRARRAAFRRRAGRHRRGAVLRRRARRLPAGGGRGGRRELHLRRPGRGHGDGLAQCGARLGFETLVVPLLQSHGRPISSSRIRRLLHEGSLPEVRAILGRPPRSWGPWSTATTRPHARLSDGQHRGAHRHDLPGARRLRGARQAARPLVPGGGQRRATTRPSCARATTRPSSASRPTCWASGRRLRANLTVDFLAKLRDEEKFPSPEASSPACTTTSPAPPRCATRRSLELGLDGRAARRAAGAAAS